MQWRWDGLRNNFVLGLTVTTSLGGWLFFVLGRGSGDIRSFGGKLEHEPSKVESFELKVEGEWRKVEFFE